MLHGASPEDLISVSAGCRYGGKRVVAGEMNGGEVITVLFAGDLSAHNSICLLHALFAPCAAAAANGGRGTAWCRSWLGCANWPAAHMSVHCIYRSSVARSLST